MTGAAPDVAARLQQLAGRAVPAGHDEAPGTAERAVAADRRRRQRAGRWTAAAVVVAVLGGAAMLTRPAEVAPVAQAAAPSARPTARPPASPTPPAPPPAVYEQPPRGSLAEDADLLAGVAALPWSPTIDPATGSAWAIEPDTRRVVYAADVPGGHRWVLVMARWRQSWAVNWFAGPEGGGPTDLTEVMQPTGWSATEPFALMDVTAPTAPLLVFGDPGDTFEYSPSLDRAPDGDLVREFEPLPMVDGIPLGVVPTPVIWSAGELREIDVSYRGPVWDLRLAGDAPWDGWYDFDGGPADEAVLGPCLTALGYTVEDGPGENDVGYSGPGPVDLSTTEHAVLEKATADCFNTAGRD